ncbi:MAG: hypothetical protein M5U26_05035 [Planctomycetota bacterium]|nr:hypothetical protein [Planctomycetota bacterium]
MSASLRAVLLVVLAGLACGTRAQDVESEPPPATAKTIKSPWRVVHYTASNPPVTPKLEELPLQESVSQYGITWTFEKPARVGRFVNGDFYAVGPVTVVKIDPKPLWGAEVGELINKSGIKEDSYPGKQARNGSVLNPAVTEGARKGGYDSRLPSGRYEPEMFAHLPIAMKPGDALVSTVSRPNASIKKFSGQHVDPLQVAAVLSCVAEPLPPDAFRPSYCDAAHSGPFLSRNLRRDLLLALPRLEGMPENLNAGAERFRKPWLDTVCFGFAAPVENLPHYGQTIVDLVGEASLLLLMDYPAEDKEQLLVHFVQVGIDLWGAARAGMTWPAHGGLYSGRKWPILLSGMLLNDEKMRAPKQTLPKLRFHEDDQTGMAPYTYKGKSYAQSWTGAKALFLGHSPYLMESMADHWDKGWGALDLFHPSEWPKRADGGKTLASEGYRIANTSSSWVSQALAARILRAEPIWNHDAFFNYVDRWMTQDDTEFAKAKADAGWQDVTGVPFGGFGRQGYLFTKAKWVRGLWDAYRDKLPPLPGYSGPPTPPASQTWR